MDRPPQTCRHGRLHRTHPVRNWSRCGPVPNGIIPVNLHKTAATAGIVRRGTQNIAVFKKVSKTCRVESQDCTGSIKPRSQNYEEAKKAHTSVWLGRILVHTFCFCLKSIPEAQDFITSVRPFQIRISVISTSVVSSGADKSEHVAPRETPKCRFDPGMSGPRQSCSAAKGVAAH